MGEKNYTREEILFRNKFPPFPGKYISVGEKVYNGAYLFRDIGSVDTITVCVMNFFIATNKF